MQNAFYSAFIILYTGVLLTNTYSCDTIIMYYYSFLTVEAHMVQDFSKKIDNKSPKEKKEKKK